MWRAHAQGHTLQYANTHDCDHQDSATKNMLSVLKLGLLWAPGVISLVKMRCCTCADASLLHSRRSLLHRTCGQLLLRRANPLACCPCTLLLLLLLQVMLLGQVGVPLLPAAAAAAAAAHLGRRAQHPDHSPAAATANHVVN
jgi:hypothetical protein